MARKRIVVIDRELCNAIKCGYQCMRSCPINRAKKECIAVSEEDKKPLVSEELCIGCGICARRCEKAGYSAISVVNLPEKLEENPVHRYGRNGFSIYRLPMPKKDMVTALIGPNGVGKSTLMNILSNNLILRITHHLYYCIIYHSYEGFRITDHNSIC